MRRTVRRAIDDWRGDVAPATQDRSADCDNQSDHRPQAALEAARRADADELPHQESEIEAADVDEEPFQDVRVATQVRPAQAARLIEMRVRPFQSLAPATLQPSTACPAYPSPVRVDGVARHRLPAPSTRPPRSGSAM